MKGDVFERQLGRVARGSALGMIGAVFSGAAGFGLVVAVARGFTPREAGLFFSATAVFLVLVAISTLGTEAGFARFLMRYEAQGRPQAIRQAVSAACLPCVGMALVLAAIAGAFAHSWGRALGPGDHLESTIYVLGLALPFAVGADLALSIVRAFGRIRATVFVDRILRSGLQTVAAVVVVAADGSLQILMFCWSGAYVVSAAVAVPLATTFLDRRLSVQPALARKSASRRAEVVHELWAFTAYRGVARVAQIAIQKADIVIVAAVISPAAAALYTAATRFVAIGQIVTQSLQQVMQPRFTAILMREDRALLHDVHRTATAWNVLVVWPIYVAVGAAPLAYLSIFGDAYGQDHTWLVVSVMAVAMLLAVSTGPVDTLLLMSGRSGLSMMNAVSALVVDIALCLALLPVLGLVGAAVAWGCAVTLRCGLAVWQVRTDLGVRSLSSEPLVAALLALACFGLPAAIWSATSSDRLAIGGVLLLLGTAAYAVLLFRLRRRLHLDVLVAALAGRTRSPGGARGVRHLAGWVRGRFPAPIVRSVRATVTAWGMLTAAWRMEPSFIIAGAQRSGTTTLFRLLAEHPNLVRPTVVKGTGYFDDHYHRGRRWYRAHFPIRMLARWRSGRRTGPLASFECSGYYMFHPLAPRRIAADLPDARVAVMLRDPVDRAISAHSHERKRGFETASFGEAIADERDRMSGEADRLAEDSGYRSFEHRHHAYLGRGEYAGQVAALMTALGRDRVYVMDADAFFADPHSEFENLQRWLGLPVWLPERVDRWNAGDQDPLAEAWRERLDQHFEPHDTALAELIGRAPSWRSLEDTPCTHVDK